MKNPFVIWYLEHSLWVAQVWEHYEYYLHNHNTVNTDFFTFQFLESIH